MVVETMDAPQGRILSEPDSNGRHIQMLRCRNAFSCKAVSSGDFADNANDLPV